MRFLALLIYVALCAADLVHAEDGVTIDNLVRRVQIPFASISRDGRFAAYILLRGDPVQNDYEITVMVAPTQGGTAGATLAKYRLRPDETFDEAEGFRSSAGDLLWLANDTLVYLARTGGRMRLLSWDPESRRSQPLTAGHDQILMSSEEATDENVMLVLKDFVDRPLPPGLQATDNAWRIRDGYRFWGALKNPMLGKWVQSQKYSMSLVSGQPIPEGEPTRSLESVPREIPYPAAITQNDSEMYRYNLTPSPSGTTTAAVELAMLDLGSPEESHASSRIILLRGNQSSVLIPFARPAPKRVILGWAPDSTSIYGVDVSGLASTLYRVDMRGRITRLYQDPSQLEIPGEAYERRGKSLSRAARTALLVRSTNLVPGQLISVDLKTGRSNVVSDPNNLFENGTQSEVRYYPIGIKGEEVYGRLYLPLHYQQGKRYPLVFTQYYSRPGFYAASGDEVPVLPLTANGVAVFTMQSSQLDQESHNGDFRLEISRVRKPLQAMEWIYRKLVADGIVDPDRVGITGLSYGAEIAMYAYWQSGIFHAASVATGSWDPSLMLFGGVSYMSRLKARGFPLPGEESAERSWRELAAGMNARNSMPPLLIQSPDGEENFAVPTWVQLRRAGASVEWYEYPNEGHVKRSPANKWWVYSRNLDWFRFWLKDEEDADPTKAEQYQRWREMRTAWEAAKKGANKGPIVH